MTFTNFLPKPKHARRPVYQAIAAACLFQAPEGPCPFWPLPERVIRPPLPPCRVGSSSPELSCVKGHTYISSQQGCHSLPAKAKKPGVDRLNSSRVLRRLPPSRRFKPQSLRVASNETCLLKVKSFLANALSVVPTRSGKQTHSEGQCR